MYIYKSSTVYTFLHPTKALGNIYAMPAVRVFHVRVLRDDSQRRWHTGNHVIGFHLRRMRSLGKGKYVDCVLCTMVIEIPICLNLSVGVLCD